jgi:NTP pyrophosphatase (non-canonical NTP hydrolase)
MTRTEHLLFMLAEECAEVAQRASKAARFGIDEIQPGQPFTNAERIEQEWNDLLAVLEMLRAEGAIKWNVDSAMIRAKKAKIEKFLRYSVECGTLTDQR